MLDRQLRHPADDVLREHGSGRVVRVAEHEQHRLLRGELLDEVEIEARLVSVEGEGDALDPRPEELQDPLAEQVVGVGQQHEVALVHQRRQRREEGALRTRCQREVGRGHRRTEEVGDPGRQRVEHLGGPAVGRVGEAAVCDGRLHRGVDPRGRGEADGVEVRGVEQSVAAAVEPQRDVGFADRHARRGLAIGEMGPQDPVARGQVEVCRRLDGTQSVGHGAP